MGDVHPTSHQVLAAVSTKELGIPMALAHPGVEKNRRKGVIGCDWVVKQFP
jgi:hypothetical protein